MNECSKHHNDGSVEELKRVLLKAMGSCQNCKHQCCPSGEDECPNEKSAWIPEARAVLAKLKDDEPVPVYSDGKPGLEHVRDVLLEMRDSSDPAVVDFAKRLSEALTRDCYCQICGRTLKDETIRNCDVLSEAAASKAWNEYQHAHAVPRGGWDFRHIIAWFFAPEEEARRCVRESNEFQEYLKLKKQYQKYEN